MKLFFSIIKRDFRLYIRQGMENLTVVMFFIIVVTLFPFGIGSEFNELKNIGAGIIWVSALLAAILSLERLFQTDYEDGSLELLALQPIALEIIVLAKALVHWLTTGITLILATPILALLMNIPDEGYWVLLLSLIIGTPSLSLIGTIGAALIIGSKRGGVLLALIILPLYIPILIFGIASVKAALEGFPIESHLMILVALFMVALALCPWAGAGAIRQALDS
jgi:heme exporter protein B